MKRLLTILLFAALWGEIAAREVFPMNEGWRFFFRSENSSDQARPVTLPHTWNTDPKTTDLWRETTANYQNDIFIPAEWSAKRIFLRFYGVQSVADLFVNGSHVGAHRGGATAFCFEITDKVRCGADNALLMVVSNSLRGDVLPTSTDMNLYGGIYREAELIVTEPTTVSPLYFGSEGVLVHPEQISTAQVEGAIEVHLTAKTESTTPLQIDIADASGRVVFTKRQRVKIENRPVSIPFEIARPQLWSPASPARYTVTATVGEGEAAERVTVTTGFRSVVVKANSGLAINGARIPVHGVTLYHDNALSGGTLTAADYDDDLSQIRELGANAIRSAVMPHAPYLYDRCDEQGIMVWVDLPLHRTSFLSDVAYFSTPQFEQNGREQLQEIIVQNINHPSVVMWGLFSRLSTRGSDPVGYIRQLNDLAHTLDPSRPTVACSDQDGQINFVTDLIVWQQDVGWSRGKTDDVAVWRDKLRKGWSQLRSGVCYGGNGFIGHRNFTAQSAPRINWMPEEKQSRFHEDYARQISADSIFWGMWINNMFDYGSSRSPFGVDGSGLVAFNRRDRKDAFYLYKALWNKSQPTLYIADRHRRLRDQEKQAFSIYSSAGTPQLLIGADTVVLTEVAPCQFRSDSVALQGTVEVKVSAGALRDSVRLRVGNVLKPKRNPALLRTAGPRTTN